MASVAASAPNTVCDVHIGTRDEAVTLRAVISTVFSTLEIDEVLAGVVDIATEATGCHACLIYLLEGDRLVRRPADEVLPRARGGALAVDGRGTDPGALGRGDRRDRAAHGRSARVHRGGR